MEYEKFLKPEKIDSVTYSEEEISQIKQLIKSSEKDVAEQKAFSSIEKMFEDMGMKPEFDELIDEELVSLAVERMRDYDTETLIPAEEFYREIGLTEKDLENYDDVEIG